MLLIAEGAAASQSYLWAAPLICLLVVAVATDLPLVPLVGITMFARILTDAYFASPTSHHTSSFGLSGLIAVLFILVAAGLLLGRRQAVRPALLATLWLCTWTGVALSTHGASTVTIREGVRELSIIAVALIVCNSSRRLTVPVVTRIVQIAGAIAALLACYQLATHAGLKIEGKIRANGTFSHPDGAAMYFAIATMASVWRYFDYGRRQSDALFGMLFAIAIIATFSIGGLAALIVMLLTFGMTRPGSARLKFGACVVGVLIVIAFLATPLGSERIAQESSTSLSSAQTRGTANSSLAWRFYKWRTLIPEWERTPFLGQGLGATVTAEGTAENIIAGKVPHNEYIRYLVETGVVGLCILLWAVYILGRGLARRKETSSPPGAGTLGIAVFAGCLFNALGANTFLYSTTGYAAALIIAAVLSSPNAPVESPLPMRKLNSAYRLARTSGGHL